MYFKVSVLCHAHNDCRDLQEQLDRQNYIIYGTNDNLKTQMRSFQDKEEWCIGVRTKGEVNGGGTEKTENENEKEREIIIATHPLGGVYSGTNCMLPERASEGGSALSTAHPDEQVQKTSPLPITCGTLTHKWASHMYTSVQKSAASAQEIKVRLLGCSDFEPLHR